MKKFNKIIIFIVLSFIAVYFIFYDRKIMEAYGGGGGRRGIGAGGNFRGVGGIGHVGGIGTFSRGRGAFNRGIGYGLGRYYVDNNYDDLGYYSNPIYIYPRYPLLYQ
jgi:hypothetical protein